MGWFIARYSLETGIRVGVVLLHAWHRKYGRGGRLRPFWVHRRQKCLCHTFVPSGLCHSQRRVPVIECGRGAIGTVTKQHLHDAEVVFVRCSKETEFGTRDYGCNL